MPPARASTSRTKRAGGGLFRRIDPLTSLLLVFPLFLVYEVGVLLVPSAYNGADLITAQIVQLLRGDVGLYVLLNLGLLGVFAGMVLYLRRENSFDPKMIWPVLIESGIYALSMGSLICFVMVDVLHVDPRLAVAAPPLSAAGAGPPGFLASIVISLGAGVHEELVFRVLMIGGMSIALHKVLGLRRGLALAICIVGSSVIFSAAHHVVGGEPLRIGVFVYRVLCGLFFALLYQLRGVAVAVYTHALYDVYVFLVKGG
jgi:hypothetical protein